MRSLIDLSTYNYKYDKYSKYTHMDIYVYTHL